MIETLILMTFIFMMFVMSITAIALWLAKVKDDIIEAIKETKPENAKKKGGNL